MIVGGRVDFTVTSDHGFSPPFFIDFAWYLPKDFPGCYISVHQKTIIESITCKTKVLVPPRKLTWLPKMMVWKMYLLSNVAILGIDAKFRGVYTF